MAAVSLPSVYSGGKSPLARFCLSVSSVGPACTAPGGFGPNASFHSLWKSVSGFLTGAAEGGSVNAPPIMPLEPVRVCKPGGSWALSFCSFSLNSSSFSSCIMSAPGPTGVFFCAARSSAMRLAFFSSSLFRLLYHLITLSGSSTPKPGSVPPPLQVLNCSTRFCACLLSLP